LTIPAFLSGATRASLAGVVLALAGCTASPQVKTDFDPSADFSRYHSYSWAYTGTPQGMNPLMFERVHASIDRALAARSYSQGNPGEFAVAFTLGRRDSVQVTDFGPYGPYYARWGWGGAYRDIDVRNVTRGTLVIDIYDTATKKPVWHGIATQEINPDKIDPSGIDTAVDAVIAKFPPVPGAK
jgi:hypothetical protein